MDTAIACETFLRTVVLASLPGDLRPSVRDNIDKSNISQYVSRYFPELLSDADATHYKKNVKEELASLFDKRNALFHRGGTSAATDENCHRFLRLLDGLLASHGALASESDPTGI